jgi:hypothetical protein
MTMPDQSPLALAVPHSRFTPRVGGGSAFYVRPTRTIMKKFTLTFICFTLSTAFALAADYYLVRTQMLDADYAETNSFGTKIPPIVYVLTQPSNQPPIVFQKFDSWQMESWLSLRARGGVVHFHASALLEPSPTAVEWEGFKTFCKTNDITIINESDTD